jgi:hypothetical protein
MTAHVAYPDKKFNGPYLRLRWSEGQLELRVAPYHLGRGRQPGPIHQSATLAMCITPNWRVFLPMYQYQIKKRGPRQLLCWAGQFYLLCLPPLLLTLFCLFVTFHAPKDLGDSFSATQRRSSRESWKDNSQKSSGVLWIGFWSCKRNEKKQITG